MVKEIKEIDKKRITKLNAEKTNLQSIKVEIESDNDTFISDKLSRLDKLIGRKKDFKPKNPNNITMKQHLINLRSEINNNPIDFVNKHIKQLENSITNLTEEIDGNSRNK